MANFGYLAAQEIEGQDTLKELRMVVVQQSQLVDPDQSSSAQSTGVAPSRRVQTSGARLTR